MQRKSEGEVKKVEKIYSVNVVDGFNPYDYLVAMRDEITGDVIVSEATGKPWMYLPTAAKKVWFSKLYPDGVIDVKSVERDDGQYQFCAKVYKNPEAFAAGEILAAGNALRTKAVNEKYRPFETAQTLAISEALENAGFGSEVKLYLLMQEACDEKAAPASPAGKSPAEEEPVKAVPNPASFTVKEAEEGTADEEALNIFTSLGVKAEEEKPKAKKKAKKAKEEKPQPSEEPAAEEDVSEDAPEPEEPPEEDTAKEGQEAPEVAAEEPEAASYVITAADVRGVHALDMFIGRTLDELGPDNIASVLELAGDKISESFRDAAKSFVA